MNTTENPDALQLADIVEQSEGWTAYKAAAELRRQHARIEDLEAQLSAIGAGGVEVPAALVSTYVEVRECSDCGHVGINDTDGSKAACNTCEWYGDSPREDKCPGCNRVGTMSAACPKCGSRTLLLAETHLLVAAPARSAEGVPVQVVELEVDDLIDRLLNAQQDLNLAANVHMDQSIASASTLLDEVEIALRALAANQPAAQGGQHVR